MVLHPLVHTERDLWSVVCYFGTEKMIILLFIGIGLAATTVCLTSVLEVYRAERESKTGPTIRQCDAVNVVGNYSLRASSELRRKSELSALWQNESLNAIDQTESFGELIDPSAVEAKCIQIEQIDLNPELTVNPIAEPSWDSSFRLQANAQQPIEVAA
jgi:hypothetical protein